MEPVSTDRRARWLRRVVVGIVVVAVVYLVWTIWDREALIAWMEDARPVPFFLAMALLPALGLPFTPFYLLAGATFALPVAALGSAIALAVNLVLCYYVGHTGLRRHLMSLFDRFGYTPPDFDATGDTDGTFRRALRFAMLVKLAPGVPGFIKNYALGAARVPFGVYFSVGMAISGGYAMLLVLFGGSLFDHEIGAGTIAVLVLAVLVLALRWWSGREPAPST